MLSKKEQKLFNQILEKFEEVGGHAGEKVNQGATGIAKIILIAGGVLTFGIVIFLWTFLYKSFRSRND